MSAQCELCDCGLGDGWCSSCANHANKRSKVQSKMSRAKAKARERALERAGYMHVSGWLPADIAQKVKEMIEENRPEKPTQ